MQEGDVPPSARSVKQNISTMWILMAESTLHHCVHVAMFFYLIFCVPLPPSPLQSRHATDSESSNLSLHVKSGLPTKAELDSEGGKLMTASSRFGSGSDYLDEASSRASGQLTIPSTSDVEHGEHGERVCMESVSATPPLSLAHGSSGGEESDATSQEGAVSLKPASGSLLPGGEAMVGEVMVDVEKVWEEDLELGVGEDSDGGLHKDLQATVDR